MKDTANGHQEGQHKANSGEKFPIYVIAMQGETIFHCSFLQNDHHFSFFNMIIDHTSKLFYHFKQQQLSIFKKSSSLHLSFFFVVVSKFTPYKLPPSFSFRFSLSQFYLFVCSNVLNQRPFTNCSKKKLQSKPKNIKLAYFKVRRTKVSFLRKY